MTIKELVEKYNDLTRTINQTEEYRKLFREKIKEATKDKSLSDADPISIRTTDAMNITSLIIRLRHYLEKDLNSEVAFCDETKQVKQTEET